LSYGSENGSFATGRGENAATGCPMIAGQTKIEVPPVDGELTIIHYDIYGCSQLLFSLGEHRRHFRRLGNINFEGNSSFRFVFTTSTRRKRYFVSIFGEFASYSLIKGDGGNQRR
jgi:hypothetical protein